LSRGFLRMVPGDACVHDVDAGLTLRRLLLAVADPERFAAELARFGDCRACSAAVLVQACYELAGLVLDCEDSDQLADDEEGCGHAVSAEAVAMRLVLSYSSGGDPDGDPDTLSVILAEIAGCTSCLISVVMALTNANVAILDGTHRSWRPVVERRLLALLDELAD